ncbi:TPA: hypothetical protein ACF3IV_001860 [Enterobacter hormaechei]
MSNIDKRATELLIENGMLVADTLRHLADNEIDSDYFAITSTSENGTETEYELAITDYALQAAGTVDELVKALEAAEKYSKDRDAENEGLSLTVGRLRVEKGAAEKTSAARLEALYRTHNMFQRERARADEAEKRNAEYRELISGLVGVSSSILREVERINKAAAAGKGEAS